MKTPSVMITGAALCLLLTACGGPFRKETTVVLVPSEPQSAEPAQSDGEPPAPPEPVSIPESIPENEELDDTNRENAEIRDYVLNTRSHKFHLPDCSGLSKMKPENRGTFHGTREAVLAEGYTPCGICKP